MTEPNSDETKINDTAEQIVLLDQTNSIASKTSSITSPVKERSSGKRSPSIQNNNDFTKAKSKSPSIKSPPNLVIKSPTKPLSSANLVSVRRSIVDGMEKSAKLLGRAVEADQLLSDNRQSSTKPNSKSENPAMKSPANKIPAQTTDTPDRVSVQKSIGDRLEAMDTSEKIQDKIIGLAPEVDTNIVKIAAMSQVLTSEANELRKSIRTLSEDLARTKQDLYHDVLDKEENNSIDFPYHLFLLELIINKIQMKCECFDTDSNNLVITATFLGKHPIVLYEPTNDVEIENISQLNVGKSTMFAMTYDKICSIDRFEIFLDITKQPPCSHCVTKIAETHMDYTKEFSKLREELCKKWRTQQPKDDIQCTTSTPLDKSQFYLSCGESENPEPIGIIEVSARMSFLGKEITTAFKESPKPRATCSMIDNNNGISMCASHKVEMDGTGNILLDEDVMTRKGTPYKRQGYPTRRVASPISQDTSISRHLTSKRYYVEPTYFNPMKDEIRRYDEICTQMNENELKIRVPKQTRVDKVRNYEKINETCICEDNPYNSGEQIQFELPNDYSNNTHSSNLKYKYNACERKYENKERKVVNVTPSNCPAPVTLEKMPHPQKDVFILKIGKRMETKDKKTDLEIELVTPKAPAAPDTTCQSKQVSAMDLGKTVNLKGKGSKSKGKKKGKGKSKGKGAAKGKSLGKGKTKGAGKSGGVVSKDGLKGGGLHNSGSGGGSRGSGKEGQNSNLKGGGLHNSGSGGGSRGSGKGGQNSNLKGGGLHNSGSGGATRGSGKGGQNSNLKGGGLHNSGSGGGSRGSGKGGQNSNPKGKASETGRKSKIWPGRVQDPRPERRDQQADAGEAALGGPDQVVGWAGPCACRTTHAGPGWQGGAGQPGVQVFWCC